VVPTKQKTKQKACRSLKKKPQKFYPEKCLTIAVYLFSPLNGANLKLKHASQPTASKYQTPNTKDARIHPPSVFSFPHLASVLAMEKAIKFLFICICSRVHV